MGTVTLSNFFCLQPPRLMTDSTGACTFERLEVQLAKGPRGLGLTIGAYVIEDSSLGGDFANALPSLLCLVDVNFSSRATSLINFLYI